MIKSFIAFVSIFIIYQLSLLFLFVSKFLPHQKAKRTNCILVTGTFYNYNWFLSHAQPLVQSDIGNVIFVTDIPHEGVDNIKFLCPPLLISKILSRAGAKFIWMFFASLYYKPDMYIGYHLFPGALSALLIGRLFGRPSCYQMCAGPVELIGGGIYSENSLLTKLHRPSSLLERMAIAVTKHFDLIAVRGNSAVNYLVSNGISPENIAILPGSIRLSNIGGNTDRKYDIVFVGRIVEIKQPHQLIEIFELVHNCLPDAKMVIAGDGPLLKKIKQYALEKKVDSSIDMLGKISNIEEVIANSKVFLLTSRNEGLSIAMAEAMAAGAVPVVADVGDLADLVKNDINGYTVEPNNISSYADHIISILQHSDKRKRLSTNAAQSARHYNGIDVVSLKWADCIENTLKIYS